MDEVSQFFSVEEKDELLPDISTSVKDIMARKCCLILRSVKQLLTIFQAHKSSLNKMLQ